MDPQRVKKVLDEVLQGLSLSRRFEEGKVYQVWEAAVGKKIAAHAHPTKMQDGKLSVKVDNTTWVQQLTFLKKRIIDEVNKQMGKESVREITFKIGKVDRTLKKKPIESGIGLNRIKLNEQRLRQVEEDLRHIRDSETKDVLRRFLTMEAKFIQAKTTTGGEPCSFGRGEGRRGRTKV